MRPSYKNSEAKIKANYQIFEDVKVMLCAGQMQAVKRTLNRLAKGISASKIKSALVMTKEFKAHPVIEKARKRAVLRCEKLIGAKLI